MADTAPLSPLASSDFIARFAHLLELKQYLSLDLRKFERSVITKIGESTHKLAIEIGRYSKPPVPASERFCNCCKNKVEDEIHFVLYCPLYQEIRKKYAITGDTQLDTYGDINLTFKLLNPGNIADAKRILSAFLKGIL